MWQGIGVGKKYKNGTGNWKIFSWNEPTGGKKARAKLNYKKNTVVHKECPKTICSMCEQYYMFCVECLWVDTTKCIKLVKCVKPPKRVPWSHYKVYLIEDMCCLFLNNHVTVFPRNVTKTRR